MDHPRIVVGVDGSSHSLQALRWAIGEAARRGGTVTAVAAWLPEVVPSSTFPLPVVEPYDRAVAEQPHRERLESAVRSATRDHPDLAVEQVVRAGTASVVLTEEAAAADLLVVGSHGRGQLLTALIGSVSAECVRTARCPVVVIPPLLADELSKTGPEFSG